MVDAGPVGLTSTAEGTKVRGVGGRRCGRAGGAPGSPSGPGAWPRCGGLGGGRWGSGASLRSAYVNGDLAGVTERRGGSLGAGWAGGSVVWVRVSVSMSVSESVSSFVTVSTVTVGVTEAVAVVAWRGGRGPEASGVVGVGVGRDCSGAVGPRWWWVAGGLSCLGGVARLEYVVAGTGVGEAVSVSSSVSSSSTVSTVTVGVVDAGAGGAD